MAGCREVVKQTALAEKNESCARLGRTMEIDI